MMLDQIILLIALLMLSGFFSSAETALFPISKTRARHLAKQKTKSLKLISQMKDDPHKLLTTILVGNNIVNVAAAAMATSMSATEFKSALNPATEVKLLKLAKLVKLVKLVKLDMFPRPPIMPS